MSIFRGPGGSGDANNNVTINEVENLRSEAVQARNDAQTAETNAENAQAYSEEWANKSEDSLVSTAAGGDGVDDYSAMHWSFKAEDEKIAAEAAKTAAESAQTSAETAQTAAETAETNAELAETNAEAAQVAAELAEDGAVAAQVAAELAETNAETAEVAAELAETNAAASASAASTSASNAATSETNAAASASAAATSEANAATSETNAATSASNAATSETNAASSATSAAASAASAAQSYDQFDDRYLGSKTSDPTLDNDGDALVTGALYFNTVENEMRIYDGVEWIAASSSAVATMNKYKFTATSGQTVFSGTDDDGNTLALTVGVEIVTLNGIVLEQGTDYTATTSAVTLTTGAATDDELNVFAFANFTVADTVSASTGGTFQDNIVVNGNVTATAFSGDGSALTGLGGGSPVGSISAFANAVPSDYLECNGAAVSRTTYADLFSYLSTTYGAGNGSTTFNLPDLRGEFIRGFDAGRGVDSGRVLGSSQAHSTELLYARVTQGFLTTLRRIPVPSWTANRKDDDAGGGISRNESTGTEISTRNLGETRPRNIAMRYGIKY